MSWSDADNRAEPLRSRSLARSAVNSIKSLARRLSGRPAFAGDFLSEPPETFSTTPDSEKRDITLGIITEFTNAHVRYITACRELGVPHRLLDISGPDWIDVVRNANCDAFLVRPSYSLSVWKQMFDERLRIIAQEFGMRLYPSYEEIWFYESKRRMSYWLQANGFPHPATWIFYNSSDALRFVEGAELPIVSKGDFGAGSSGVTILKNRTLAQRHVRRAFRRGIVRRGGDRRDREWGTVLLQEYLKNVREWRMVRIGESYFGHLKLRRGEFHSGSGRAGWEDPPEALLTLTRDLTERGRFTSMALDVFETPNGRFLVNELQTVFGFAASRQSQMLVEGKSGRYVYDSDKWRFQEGDFSSGGCYRLRVETLLESLERTRVE